MPNITHLKKLLEIAKNIPEKKFDLDIYWDEKTNKGCLLGNASLNTYFQELGIHSYEGMTLTESSLQMKKWLRILDIDEQQFIYLFYPVWNSVYIPDKSTVIGKLEKFLSDLT